MSEPPRALVLIRPSLPRRLRAPFLALPAALAWAMMPACAQAQAAAEPAQAAQTTQAPASGQAAKGTYLVRIDAPDKLQRLLTDNLEIVRLAKDGDVPDEELQRLTAVTSAQIRELLATEGYFAPELRSELTIAEGRREARFTVEPGPPVTVEEVQIDFSGHIVSDPEEQRRVERLRRQWGLQRGERFRQEEWDNSKSALLQGLLGRDYPAARITASEARIDPAARSARLSVQVDSGPPFTFGALQIEGLKRYPRNIIDELNPIVPGEAYTQNKLNDLQSRLQDSGYFRSVFATIEVDPQQPQNVPVKVDVNENERKRLSFGLGISTDVGVRVQAKWLDRLFMDSDRRLESELVLDRETQRLGGELFYPALGPRWDYLRGWRPSVHASYERTDMNNAINNKIRTGARVTSPERNDMKTWALSYYADRQRIAGGEPNYRRALVPSFTYVRRRVDNDLLPRRGYFASVEVGAGARGLLSDANLVRAVARATWLHPVEQSWQWVMRGQVGQVFLADRRQVPEDLLFRTGGDQSVRGYGYNTLGVADGSAIVGGTVTAVISAELVYRITREWGAAVFTDAGNAADSWHDFRLKQGTGIGARWRGPLGAVNVDLAYGHATREVRLHFSIGYGF